MPVALNAVLWRSVRAHALLEPVKNVEAAVRAAAGIYGAAPTCYFSLAARVTPFQRADLDRALYEQRSLVRVPAMRGSVYVLPLDLAPCGLALAGATGIEGTLKRAGVDAAQYASLASMIEDLLAGGPLTAAEIREGLHSWREPHTGALTLVLRNMSHEGRIVRGRVRGSLRSQSFEYARYADWTGAPPQIPTRQEALRRLAPLYFAANGPATLADFAWWAGATKAEVAAAVEDLRLEEVAVRGLDASLLATPESLEKLAQAPAEWYDVHLLPYWDSYVMAHADRRRYLDSRRQNRVIDPGGNATNVILKAGTVAGLWDLDGSKLLLTRFEKLGPTALREAVQRSLESLGIEIGEATVVRSQKPLTGQNEFMAPLRNR